MSGYSSIVSQMSLSPSAGYQGRQACSSTDSSVTSAFTMVAGAEEGRGISGEVDSVVARGDKEQRMEGPAVRPGPDTTADIPRPATGLLSLAAANPPAGEVG